MSKYANKIMTGDNVEIMRKMPGDLIDLTVTSPPYDGMRNYNGYSFDFESVAKELYRVTKPGGVVVWVVGDSTTKGNESGTSFRQALYFKEIGFNLLDTMIYEKDGQGASGSNYAYWQSFEYMFVLTKGKPETVNRIRDRINKSFGRKTHQMSKRLKNGETEAVKSVDIKEFGFRTNVWKISSGNNKSTKDRIAFEHPAIFPEQLAGDHIVTWSNPGDLIFDPFGGSGTTAKMAKMNGRNYLHLEVSEEYNKIARQRVDLVEERD